MSILAGNRHRSDKLAGLLHYLIMGGLEQTGHLLEQALLDDHPAVLTHPAKEEPVGHEG